MSASPGRAPRAALCREEPPQAAVIERVVPLPELVAARIIAGTSRPLIRVDDRQRLFGPSDRK